MAAAWLCFGAVLVDYLALRFVGERWWLTTLALYAPHLVLLAPISLVAFAVALVGPRRLLLLQVGAAAILLFPIMGLEVAGPALPTPGAPRLRVLSFNVNGASVTIPEVVAEVRAAEPDIILLQGSGPSVNDAVLAVLPAFGARSSAQFLIASRYHILDFHEPAKVNASEVDRSPRFVRATLDTPLGKVDVYAVHPISPREPVESVRGDGFLVGLRTGAIFDVDRDVIASNTRLRRMQAEAIAELAAASPNPVIIAGDTNLPSQSRIFAETIGRWSDGFATVGRGLGYTFPVGRRFPWMRIDRILAGPELRFLDFGVGSGRGSDHRCVWADIEGPAKSVRHQVTPSEAGD